jgi:hypothetical protein
MKPQCLENDLYNSLLDARDITLVVFDEGQSMIKARSVTPTKIGLSGVALINALVTRRVNLTSFTSSRETGFVLLVAAHAGDIGVVVVVFKGLLHLRVVIPAD